MPKFLNNLDLNGNQLLNPVIHVSSQSTTTNGPNGDTSGTEGQIFYNSHANGKQLYFRDNSSWRPIGDISGVSAGAGLSGGGTGGDVALAIDISEFSDVTPANGDKLLTLDSDGSTEQLTTIASLATLFAGAGLTDSNSVMAVGQGDGITVNANDVAVTAAQTTITSVVNTSLEIGRDADNRIKFGTDNQIIFEVSGGDNVIMKASGEIEASSLDISGDIDIDGTANLDAVDIDGIVNFAAVDHVMQNGANINDPSDNLLIGFATNAVTLGPTIFDSTLTVESDIIHKDDTNNKISFGTDTQTFTTGGSARLTITDATTTVSNNLAITGDLIVSGTTTTVDTATLTVEDPLIRLAKGNTSADAVDIGFFGVYDTSGSQDLYSGLFRDANDSGKWKLFKDSQTDPGTGTTINTGATGYAVATLVANLEGDVTGNASGLSSTLAVSSGGTGATSLTDGGVLLGSGTGAITPMAVLADGEMIVGDGSGDPVAESGATLRTSIGVGTGDSPQFTAVNIGHASDTTLARSAAGKATIEGQLIGVVETFHLDHSDGHVSANNSSSDSTEFTITHGMGDSRFYKVEVIQDSGNYDTVYVDVTRPSDTTIKVTFGAAVANGAYRAMVTRMA